jgi:hypothetical protein
LQPFPITNSCSCGNNLDIRNIADNLKVHDRSSNLKEWPFIIASIAKKEI